MLAAQAVRNDRAKTPRHKKRCPNFAAYDRAERKKSRKFALRATIRSFPSSFRTVCVMRAQSPPLHPKEDPVNRGQHCVSGHFADHARRAGAAASCYAQPEARGPRSRFSLTSKRVGTSSIRKAISFATRVRIPAFPTPRRGESWNRTFWRDTRGIPQFMRRKRSGSITSLTGGASLIPREAPARQWTAVGAIPTPIPGPLRERHS